MPIIITYSMSKSAFIFLWLVVILWIFYTNIVYFYFIDIYIRTFLNNILIISGDIFIILTAFYSYIRYSFFNNRIEINRLFNKKPFKILFYKDIIKILAGEGYGKHGFRRYYLYIQFNNETKERLLFFDRDILKNTLELLTKIQPLQDKIGVS